MRLRFLSLVALLALAPTAARAQNLGDLAKSLGRSLLERASGGARHDGPINLGAAAAALGSGFVGRSADRRQREYVSGALAKYNAAQPAFDFAGQTIELRLSPDSYSYVGNANWLVSAVRSALTDERVGAVVSLDVAGIRDESEDREYLRSNPEVAPETLARRATIKVARYVIELEAIELSSSSAASLFLGGWNSWRQADWSSEMTHFGLAASVRRREDGVVLAVYKAVGSARDVAVRGESGGFFSRLGGDYRADGPDNRAYRALEAAVGDLRRVFIAKNQPPPGRRSSPPP